MYLQSIYLCRYTHHLSRVVLSDLSSFACVFSGALKPNSLKDIEAGISPMPDFAYMAKHGAEIFSATPPETFRQKTIQRFFGARFKIANDVIDAAHNFDCIYIVAEDVGVPVFLTKVLRRSKTPVALGIHGHYLENTKFKTFARMAGNHPQLKFLCLSKSIRDQLVNDLQVAPERCLLHCVPVDDNFFTPKPKPDGVKRPLLISAGAAGRDYETFVDAVRDLDVDVRIASGSSWIEDAETFDMPKNVVMKTAGTMAGLRDLYVKADVVVVPLHDTFHATGYSVIMEAMAMGRAVISTATKCPSDFLINDETGLLVPPGDPAALRQAVERLLGDEALREKLANAGREMMVSNFGLAPFGEKVDGLLEWARNTKD